MDRAVLDFNGNGRRASTSSERPADPAKASLTPATAALLLAPARDGSVWGTTFGFPGAVIRLTPREPTLDALPEISELPRDCKPAEASPRARRRRPTA